MLPLRSSASGMALALVASTLFVLPACGEKSSKLTVSGLDPRTGDASGGTRVVINGSNFSRAHRNVKVYFGDERGTYLRTADDDTILVEAPGGKAGDTVDVLVVFEPGGEITIPRAFTFVDRRPLSARDLAVPTP